MSAGYAVRVFQSEDFEWLNEETHYDGAHEERTGAAEEASDGHNLWSNIRVQICCCCVYVCVNG